MRTALALLWIAFASAAQADCYPGAVVGIDLGTQGFGRPFLTIDAEGTASLRQRGGEAIEHRLDLTEPERGALFSAVLPLSALDGAAMQQALPPTLPIADGIETTISLSLEGRCHQVGMRNSALLADRFPDIADLQTFRRIEELLIALVVRLQTGG